MGLWKSTEVLADLGKNPEQSVLFKEPSVRKYKHRTRRAKKSSVIHTTT